jgi:hypothetical protein
MQIVLVPEEVHETTNQDVVAIVALGAIFVGALYVISRMDRDEAPKERKWFNKK